MSRCCKPIYAVDLGVKENGKRNIKILPRRVDLYSIAQLSARYGKEAILPLPCGQCINCKLNKAKEWAVRCVCEASCYDDNYFLTLTYQEDKLPNNSSLVRKDLQDFIKRLRNYVPGVRYFGCGEYGSKYARPHYHLILFNCKLDDYKPVRKTFNGGYIYSSKLIEKLWPKGFVTLGEVSYSSCAYVARYACKKVFHKAPVGKAAEFVCMSLKPGIGYSWLQDHFNIFDNGSIYGSFGNSRAVGIPRYYEKVFELIDPEKLKALKDKRVSAQEPLNIDELLHHGFDSTEKLLVYNGRIALDAFKKRQERKDL